MGINIETFHLDPPHYLHIELPINPADAYQVHSLVRDTISYLLSPDGEAVNTLIERMRHVLKVSAVYTQNCYTASQYEFARIRKIHNEQMDLLEALSNPDILSNSAPESILSTKRAADTVSTVSEFLRDASYEYNASSRYLGILTHMTGLVPAYQEILEAANSQGPG